MLRDKDFFKSKTIQGLIAAVGMTYLIQSGIVDSMWFTELIRMAGVGWTGVGFRDAV